MHIKHIELSNFRKLLAVRIDLADETTLFVGANNSGKTSAMLAMRRFLTTRGRRFETHDITLCHWSGINALGDAWLACRDGDVKPDLAIASWAHFMPTMDLWVTVSPRELHHVSRLVPTLDWAGGLLGIRLRLEPIEPQLLYKAFLDAVAATEAMKAVMARAGDPDAAQEKLTLWPSNLMDFLARRLDQHFKIRAYALDPQKLVDPAKARARPQVLADDAVPLEIAPLSGLIRVDEINAQRGFGEANSADPDEAAPTRSAGHRLSDQLRAYYNRHLDPSDSPDAEDLGALQAIEQAQDAFDARLTESFQGAFSEVQGIGYPGVTDPRPHVSTRLRAVDGLNHQAAVSFEVDMIGVDGAVSPVKALAQAAFATFPFLTGEKLFGVEYRTPVLLRSAGARYRPGNAPVVWKDLVAARPAWVVYSDGNSLRTLIDIKAAEEALLPHLPFINHHALALEYGLSSHDLKRLTVSGVLPPTGIPGLSRRKTLACAPAARAALDAYFSQAKLDRSEEVVQVADNDNATADSISLVALSKRYAIEISTALDLIDRGRLKTSKLPRSSNPYGEIGVDPIEAIRAVYGVQDPMTSREVRDLLQLHNRALDMLVDAGFLSPKTRKFVNGKMSVFERSEIEQFRKTYVTFGELLRSGICRWGENLTPKWESGGGTGVCPPRMSNLLQEQFSDRRLTLTTGQNFQGSRNARPFFYV